MEKEKIEFKSRADSIFGCLDDLEKKHEQIVEEFSDVDQRESGNAEQKRRSDLHINRPRHDAVEGHSRKRNCSNKKSSQVPNHVVNPKKWQKYSLRDDGSKSIKGGMTPDQLNKAIALDFIDSLKSRKSTENTPKLITTNDPEDNHKFVFKKPQERNEDIVKTANFGSAHSAQAVVMKTFEFGKGKQRKEPKVIKENTSTRTNKVELVFDSEIDLCSDATENETVDKKLSETKIIFNKKKSKRNIRKPVHTNNGDDEES